MAAQLLESQHLKKLFISTDATGDHNKTVGPVFHDLLALTPVGSPNNFRGIVGKEPYPVGRKATEILRRLVLRGVERLKNLFKGNKSRSEIVATFLAVLEMCKTGSVRLEDDITGENPNVRMLEQKEGGETNGTN